MSKAESTTERGCHPTPVVPPATPSISIKLTAPAQQEQKESSHFLLRLLDKALPGASVGANIISLFSPLTPTELDGLVERAIKKDPEYKPVDLNAWYQVFLREQENSSPEVEKLSHQEEKKCPDDEEREPECPPHFRDPRSVDQLAVALRRLRAEVASVAPIRSAPPPAPLTGPPQPFDPDNCYLGTAQSQVGTGFRGLNIESAWSYGNGSSTHGNGVNCVDIEYNWNLPHEDLDPSNPAHVNGPLSGVFWPGFGFHGTNVLGTLFMQPIAGKGGVGIAWKGAGWTIGQIQPVFDADGNVVSQNSNIALAIAQAYGTSGAPAKSGDVILLECQNPDLSGSVFWPAEIDEAVFDIICNATSCGIIVVEAAGNSASSLDNYVDGNGRHVLTPGVRGHSSGALVVGASTSNTLQRWNDSSTNVGTNYGLRVDVFAWGENVYTTGGSSDQGWEPNDYRPNGSTTAFGGTSSASAIIAGAAMVLQGITKHYSSNKPLTSDQMRAALVNSATPSANGLQKDQIGVMPNLYQYLLSTHFAPQLLMHKSQRHHDLFGPDIILRHHKHVVIDPHEPEPECDPIVPNHNNFISIRLFNQSKKVAINVTADLYWSPVHLLPNIASWKHNKIGTAKFPSTERELEDKAASEEHAENIVTDENINKQKYYETILSTPLLWHPTSLPSVHEDIAIIAISTCPASTGVTVSNLDFAMKKKERFTPRPHPNPCLDEGKPLVIREKETAKTEKAGFVDETVDVEMEVMIEGEGSGSTEKEKGGISQERYFEELIRNSDNVGVGSFKVERDCHN